MYTHQLSQGSMGPSPKGNSCLLKGCGGTGSVHEEINVVAVAQQLC